MQLFLKKSFARYVKSMKGEDRVRQTRSYTFMLPLDKLTKEARIGFSDRGVSIDDLSMVLELDLDGEGNFGETFLGFSAKNKKLYVMSVSSDNETVEKRKKARKAAEDAKARAAKSKKAVDLDDIGFIPDLFKNAEFKEFDMKKVSDAYVDNFVSSNRLLAKDHPHEIELPKKEGEKVTYNVGTIEGGTSVNTIAQNAKMLYEYRSDDKECLAIMQKFFEETMEKAKKTSKAKISVKLLGERPCEADIDREYYEKFVQNAVSVCEKYSGLPCITESGSTDCNIPASMGIPSVCVGTHISKGAHTREEILDITSMPIGYKITAELILSYFK